MAQKTVVTLIDDLDGSPAAGTITFGLDGTTYEIDLSEAHAEDIREVLAPYVSAARRAGTTAQTRGSTTPRSRGSQIDPKAVRVWAESHGVEVNARGRLSAAVVEQYRAAKG